MRIDAYRAAVGGKETASSRRTEGRFAGQNFLGIVKGDKVSANILCSLQKTSDETGDSEGEETGEESQATSQRSEAEKIYQAAVSGKKNPLEELRHAPKVPYEHLAKGGVIEYNGVCFVCDEDTNSICLGDMTDKKNVLTIALSGGGFLKVNRANIGELSRAAGMFTPEDLNLIMRAIAQDTKLQATEKELEDMEANVGNQLQRGED